MSALDTPVGARTGTGCCAVADAPGACRSPSRTVGSSPRIHGELRPFGFDISERRGSRCLHGLRRRPEARPSWLTFPRTVAIGTGSPFVPLPVPEVVSATDRRARSGLSPPDAATRSASARPARPGETEAIALLREAAGEERGFWILDALARVDIDWLLANARAVVPIRALGGVLRALPDRRARAKLLRALAPWDPAERAAALAAPFWAVVPDAAALRRALERA